MISIRTPIPRISARQWQPEGRVSARPSCAHCTEELAGFALAEFGRHLHRDHRHARYPLRNRIPAGNHEGYFGILVFRMLVRP